MLLNLWQYTCYPTLCPADVLPIFATTLAINQPLCLSLAPALESYSPIATGVSVSNFLGGGKENRELTFPSFIFCWFMSRESIEHKFCMLRSDTLGN
jgi:hypothetical protein